MQISVIIPVYNAASYIEQSVQSALIQLETAEVILIEDGSPDNSLIVCQALAEKYDRVQLLCHPGGENRGAGASRNLGMKHAQYDYITFLDADDYYLLGRFKVSKEIFKDDPDCDGVYEAIGTYVEDDESRERWFKSREMQSELITMTKTVTPSQLFEMLVMGGAGYFHLDGFTFKKSLIDKTGYMREDLRLHQDNEFMYRLAALAKLVPGRLDEPVAIRRVHRHNRITAPRSEKQKFDDRMKMYKLSSRWFRENTGREKSSIILRRLISFWSSRKRTEGNPMCNEIINRFHMIALIPIFPEVIFELYYWIKFLPLRLQKKFS